ncbi:hypothetical protein [Longimicrobium sp.]|jgi:hypothetical protein|uniref:hypothetical protein n=1 Tax=Longimicrobium sp. TaxID=2029185 RepID=UPI002ED9EB89
MTALSPEIGRCPNCRASIRQDHPYQWCSECGQPLPVDLRPAVRSAPAAAPSADPLVPRVMARHFRSSYKSWDEMFGEAAAFATQVGRGRLITIGHSADQGEGVVTVWYWSA